MNKMTKMVIAPVLMAITFGSFTASAASTCASKQAAIEAQIRIAEQYGNYYKVAGLKKALAEVIAHCSDAGLIKDAEKKVAKLEQKVYEKRQDISSVQADLNEARAKGDIKKIAKYEKKLAEQQAKLQQLLIELEAAKSELASLKR
jgi:hypothetical protein